MRALGVVLAVGILGGGAEAFAQGNPGGASSSAGPSRSAAPSSGGAPSNTAAPSSSGAPSNTAAPSSGGAPSSAAAAEGAPTARELARAAFARGEQAARELHFQEALTAYEEAFARDPSAPFAPTARARASELRAHAEGGFEPLAKLEAVRRDAAKNREATAIAELEREARGFPDGRVRSEALLVVAQAYAHVLGEPERALGALEAILKDEHADRSTRALALSEALTLYRAKDDLDGALAAVSRDPELLPTMTREVRADVRRVRIAWVCGGALVALVLAALWGGARAALRLGDVRAVASLLASPRALLFAFYVGAGGAVFVRLNGGEGDPLPFVGLGLGIALIGTLVRMWSLAEERSSRPMIAVRATAGALGVIAIAYLILWKVNGGYLVPLGL